MSKTIHLKWSRTEEFDGHFVVDDDFDTTDDEAVMDFVNNRESYETDKMFTGCTDLTVEAEVAE